MTIAQFKSILEEIPELKGKIVYRQFKEGSAPALPFVCFYVNDTDNFKADNKSYLKRQNIIVELYTATKSPATEQLIETALDNAGIPWDYTETYIDSESCYLIAYNVEV